MAFTAANLMSNFSSTTASTMTTSASTEESFIKQPRLILLLIACISAGLWLIYLTLYHSRLLGLIITRFVNLKYVKDGYFRVGKCTWLYSDRVCVLQTLLVLDQWTTKITLVLITAAILSNQKGFYCRLHSSRSSGKIKPFTLKLKIIWVGNGPVVSKIDWSDTNLPGLEPADLHGIKPCIRFMKNK